MNEYRTHNCGELRIENKGQEVKLAGWVQKIRNLGKMQFIDLRDEFGITQIIISDNDEMCNKTKDLTKVKQLIDAAYVEAQKILLAHMDILNAVANTLMEKETISEEEFETFFTNK